jgi:Mce-associated membrane protein
MHEQQLAGEFTAAARQVVVTLMSIDAAKAKDDAQRIIDSSTGAFRDEFQNAAEAFVKTAQQAKVSTTTTVQDAAVDSMTDDTAVVLVAAKSTVTNAAGVKEEPRTWRLSVHLVRDDGQLKMSTMEFIP